MSFGWGKSTNSEVSWCSSSWTRLHSNFFPRQKSGYFMTLIEESLVVILKIQRINPLKTGQYKCKGHYYAFSLDAAVPNQIAGPGPKSGPARKSESRGPENGVSRWRRPNSDIYSQNHHFGLVYDMIYQFLGMEAKNYKFGMFCQQCHPSVASGDADIRPRNASRIHTCHLFTS